MLYTTASKEVHEKDISGKYLTPFGYVNSAPDGKPASDPSLAKQLWERSMVLYRKHMPDMKIPDGLSR